MRPWETALVFRCVGSPFSSVRALASRTLLAVRRVHPDRVRPSVLASVVQCIRPAVPPPQVVGRQWADGPAWGRVPVDRAVLVAFWDLPPVRRLLERLRVPVRVPVRLRAVPDNATRHREASRKAQ